MIFISVVLLEHASSVFEIDPIVEIDRRIRSDAQEFRCFFRDDGFACEFVIEDDENDFRFVVMIQTAGEFEIVGEIVSAVYHASIVPRKWQSVKHSG